MKVRLKDARWQKSSAWLPKPLRRVPFVLDAVDKIYTNSAARGAGLNVLLRSGR